MKKTRQWRAAFLLAAVLFVQAVLPAGALAAAPDPVLGVAGQPESEIVEIAPAPAPEEEPEKIQAVYEDPGQAPVTEEKPAPPEPESAGRTGAKTDSASSGAAATLWVRGYHADEGYIEVGGTARTRNARVVVRVFAASDPETIRTYLPSAGEDGRFSLAVPISDFAGREGWYQLRLLEGADGALTETASCAAPVSYAHGTVNVRPKDDTDTAFIMSVDGSGVPRGVPVFFRVRKPSEKGDEGRVYPSVRRGDSIQYTAFVSHHKEAGTYQVSAYAGKPDAGGTFLGSSRFTVEGLRSAQVGITDINGTTGDFRVALSADAPSGVSQVRFAVWNGPEHENLQWYDGVRDETGAFAASLNIFTNGTGFGTYGAQAEIVLGNGICEVSEAASSEIAPYNYLTVERTGYGRYRVSVLGADPEIADAMEFAAWSDENGWDDVVWFDRQTDENGVPYAVVNAVEFETPGAYTAQVSADGSVVGEIGFEIPASEFMTEAERRIARDVQRVYDKVGTDLHDCYMWVINNYSYVRRSGHLKPPSGYTREQWYAVEGLEKHSGNCYTFAASFCELAKGLGYDAEYVEGAVFGVGQKWWPHGFVLIHRQGGTYICDPELQFASSAGRNLYMQPVSNPKATYRW